MEMIEFKVSVHCSTYNHESYIKDALNGFTMQETTFPFVCAIIDDASTDSEPEIIKQYLQEHFELNDNTNVRKEETDDYVMIFTQHKTNKNCYFAVYFLKYNHHSIKKDRKHYIKEWDDQVEYISCCEGDDYWINPNKLQKQIIFLDQNLDYSGVYGNRIINDEIVGKIKKVKNHKRELTLSDIMAGEIVGVQNLCYRTSVRNLILNVKANGDILTNIKCAMSGILKYMDEDFAVYRYSGKGIASSRSKTENIIEHYSQWYNIHKEFKFIYYRSLIKFQTSYFFRNIFHDKELKTHISCIKLYGVKRAHLWYVVYSVSAIYHIIKNKLF